MRYTTRSQILDSNTIYWCETPEPVEIDLSETPAPIKDVVLRELSRSNWTKTDSPNEDTVVHQPGPRYIARETDVTIIGREPDDRNRSSLLYMNDQRKILGPIKKPTTDANHKAIAHYIRRLFPEYLSYLTSFDFGPTRSEPGTTVECGISLLYNHHNYSHFLLEELPKLHRAKIYAEQSGRRPRLLVRPSMPGWQREMLDVLVDDSISVKTIEKFPVHVTEFLMIDFRTVGSTYFDINAEDMTWLSEHVTKAVSMDATRFSKRVFLSRQNVRRRKIVNFETISDVLAEFDFEIVAPEDLSFRDQVRLFQQADAIVGGLGAAFSNMIFGGGIKLFPIYPLNWYPPIYFVLKEIVDHEWHPILSSAEQTDGPNEKFQDIYVDPDDLRTKLHDVLK
jgi:hypothetical protein